MKKKNLTGTIFTGYMRASDLEVFGDLQPDDQYGNTFTVFEMLGQNFRNNTPIARVRLMIDAVGEAKVGEAYFTTTPPPPPTE